GFNPIPNYNEQTGVYEPEGFPASSEFTWSHVGSLSGGDQALDGGSIKTTEDLTTLGTVTGNINLTIGGATSVAGSVYGGGEESGVTGDIEVTLQGQTQVTGNVYGGGNRGAVNGNTSVILKD
ncbi:MAG: hypothetical protein IKS44_02660, partial [Bacteroidales bacterium]|nr:hypothetical protein [Bacteroidales bacterium]